MSNEITVDITSRSPEPLLSGSSTNPDSGSESGHEGQTNIFKVQEYTKGLLSDILLYGVVLPLFFLVMLIIWLFCGGVGVDLFIKKVEKWGDEDKKVEKKDEKIIENKGDNTIIKKAKEFSKRADQVSKGFKFVRNRFVIFVLILLILNLTIPEMKSKMVLGSELWKWTILFTLVSCGYRVTTLGTRSILWLLEYRFNMVYRLNEKNGRYWWEGLRVSINLVVYSWALLITWVFYFRSIDHGIKRNRDTQVIVHVGTCTFVTLAIGAVLWMAKNMMLLVWELDVVYNRFVERILSAAFQLYFLDLIILGSKEDLTKCKPRKTLKQFRKDEEEAKKAKLDAEKIDKDENKRQEPGINEDDDNKLQEPEKNEEDHPQNIPQEPEKNDKDDNRAQGPEKNDKDDNKAQEPEKNDKDDDNKAQEPEKNEKVYDNKAQEPEKKEEEDGNKPQKHGKNEEDNNKPQEDKNSEKMIKARKVKFTRKQINWKNLEKKRNASATAEDLEPIIPSKEKEEKARNNQRNERGKFYEGINTYDIKAITEFMMNLPRVISREDDGTSDVSNTCKIIKPRNNARRNVRNIPPKGKIKSSSNEEKGVTVKDLKKFKSINDDDAELLLWDLQRELLLDNSEKISYENFEKSMVRAHKNCVALGQTLLDAIEVVKVLDKVTTLVLIAFVVIAWLLVTDIATDKILVLIASPFLAATFVFGDTCKKTFEGIIFSFVNHPFDVGDLCIIDGKMLEVKRMGIFATKFILISTKEEASYPNSTLATQSIINLKGEPDPNDSVELKLEDGYKTKLHALKEKVTKFFKNDGGKRFEKKATMTIEEIGNTVRLKIHYQHVMSIHEASHSQCFERKRKQRSEFLFEIAKYLNEPKAIVETKD